MGVLKLWILLQIILPRRSFRVTYFLNTIKHLNCLVRIYLFVKNRTKLIWILWLWHVFFPACSFPPLSNGPVAPFVTAWSSLLCTSTSLLVDGRVEVLPSQDPSWKKGHKETFRDRESGGMYMLKTPVCFSLGKTFMGLGDFDSSIWVQVDNSEGSLCSLIHLLILVLLRLP